MENALQVVLLVGGIPGLIILCASVGKALSHGIGCRMGGGDAPAGDDEVRELFRAQTEQLTAVTERLDASEHRAAEAEGRLAELAEWLDFAERLLARSRERDLLRS